MYQHSVVHPYFVGQQFDDAFGPVLRHPTYALLNTLDPSKTQIRH
jgi:hypothetical protein